MLLKATKSKRETSAARAERANKRKFIEEVYEDRIPEPIFDYPSNILEMVGKSIGTRHIETNDRGTQYREQNSELTNKTEIVTPLKVKFQRKMTKVKENQY